MAGLERRHFATGNLRIPSREDQRRALQSIEVIVQLDGGWTNTGSAKSSREEPPR